MSFPRHTDYVDSGTGWLGDYPSHWKVVPVWTLFRRTKRQGFPEEELLSVYRDHGVVPKSSRDDNNNKPSDDLSAYQLVNAGDLVINKMKAWQGSVAISGVRGIVSPAYFTYEATHDEDQRYLHYLMRSQRYITGYLSLSKGIRVNQWDLEPQYHSRMPVLLPPKDEQQRISSLLDNETAKIDALVEEQKRLIDLLKEKRQAVISQAVTKGLDPNVPMKDSGVEWLGDVPAHWQVRPLKKCIAFQEGPGIMAADFRDVGVPLLRISCVQSEVVTLDGCNYLDPDKVARQWSHFRVKIGDLLISGSASMGVVSEVGEEAAGAVPYTGLMRLQGHRSGMLKDFIKHLVVSDSFVRQVQLLKTGSTIQHFGPTHLNQMIVVLPPEDEQAAISNFLTSENTRIESLCSEAEAGMTLLQERRSALISAAVTGKIDVRGLAPQ